MGLYQNRPCNSVYKICRVFYMLQSTARNAYFHILYVIIIIMMCSYCIYEYKSELLILHSSYAETISISY